MEGVAQACLELLESSDILTSDSQALGTTGVHTPLCLLGLGLFSLRYLI